MTARSEREMPDIHKWVLAYMRREGRPLQVKSIGLAVTNRNHAYRWHIGYDRAYGALVALERRGLVRKLPGRPARFEAVYG